MLELKRCRSDLFSRRYSTSKSEVILTSKNGSTLFLGVSAVHVFYDQQGKPPEEGTFPLYGQFQCWFLRFHQAWLKHEPRMKGDRNTASCSADLLFSCHISIVFVPTLTSIRGLREGKQKKTDTYVFFNVGLSIFSTMGGLASLTDRNVMIISWSDFLCRVELLQKDGCICIMERLTITALLISGGIRRLMKWGELMSLSADPCEGALVSYIQEAVFLWLLLTSRVKRCNFDMDVAVEFFL